MKMNINKKQRITIAAILIMGGLATFMTMNVMSSQSAVAQVANHLPIPPDPFKIAVNGHTTPAIVATVKRGQTSQIDVFVSPNISGITGDVEVSSVFPMCGTVDTHQRCTPTGIITTLSANKVTTASHMVVTLNVLSNMPVGMYLFHVVSSTTLNVPFQATPVHVGDSASFAIKVI